MRRFINPSFCTPIVHIAQAYGGLGFWLENMTDGLNPDAIWRALLVIGCLKVPRLAPPARQLLNSEDSRVRAWACYALGQLSDETSLERISAMTTDPSGRVRVHARLAVRAITKSKEIPCHSRTRIPCRENLVLISEDSEKMRAELCDLCSKLGFATRTASTERETVELALELKPQAVITDNQKQQDNLSGLNMVWDLCRCTELRETLVFMFTADFAEPIFLWNGGDYFFSKFLDTLGDVKRVLTEYLSPSPEVAQEVHISAGGKRSMSLSDITSRQAVLGAVEEFDQIGRQAFLNKYGFGQAREYFLDYGGHLYDSKAIVGVAYGYQFPERGPLKPSDFIGGKATVQPKLESLGFHVRVVSRDRHSVDQ